jgi:1,2-diacylglycerol-3-alpha-glucose alpha-1,2-galactosyltransferase
VNLVSESTFTVGGHGVHSVFLEDLHLLGSMNGIDATVNRWRGRAVQHVHTIGPIGAAHLRRAHGRSVITAHLTPGSLTDSLAGDRRWQRPFMRHVVHCYNLAGTVLALNTLQADELRALGVRRPIRVVANTLDVAALQKKSLVRQKARIRLGLPADRSIIVCVGQVQPRKGVYTFLRCAEDMPRTLFCWVGGTIFGYLAASRRRLRRIMEEPPSNLMFTGPLPRATVYAYLSAADLFFLPSYHENGPMAVLEAAGAGAPILLRDLPQYRVLYGNAPLYGGENSFVHLIRSCLSDLDLSGQLSRRSATIAKRFDSQMKAPLLRGIYSDLLRVA